MTIMTTQEFANANKIEYVIAAGTLKFLLSKGLVTEAGQRPSATGKGKPSTLYNIPNNVSLSLTGK